MAKLKTRLILKDRINLKKSTESTLHVIVDITIQALN